MASVGAFALWRARVAKCPQELELRFDPEPLLLGAYRIEVWFEGYSASCAVHPPQWDLHCLGDRMTVRRTGGGVSGVTIPGHPAAVHTRVYRDGALLRERTLYPWYGERALGGVGDCFRHKALWTL